MAFVQPPMSRQERVEQEAEVVAARVMGQMNALAWQLVEMMVEVLEAAAWAPWGGLRSPEHWLCWRTGVSPSRSAKLTQIARRVEELPGCIALFRVGRLTEDAMALIARKLPAERDQEVADLAPSLLHTQLARILKHLPDQKPKAHSSRERKALFGFREDGWWESNVVLPPDEGAVAQKALEASRSDVFRERAGDDDQRVRGPVSWADGFVRMAETALDALDPATRRGQARGERAQVIVHLDGRSDGDGQARIHLGPQLPDALRRYLCCDAKVRAVVEDGDGRVVGITPLEPTVNPRLRAVIEERDRGCRYPGCSQQRWVQVHHLVHREDGGLTIARNLCCLCPFHHRLHHLGAFTIEGDPELPVGLRFVDHWGRGIGPPGYGPLAPPAFRAEPTFTPPTGETLNARWHGWS